MRTYRQFLWKDSAFRIASSEFEAVTREVVRQRGLLEGYIQRCPAFRTALEPVNVDSRAPRIARRMQMAAAAVGVGPMAAVAGAIAQFGAEAALGAGADEAIVENGGDTYLASPSAVLVGLHAGPGPLGDRLAFSVEPSMMPVSICSSSGTMGHSTSFGRCELATVVARDAALADAAATLACNLVRSPQDMAPALDRIAGIRGVMGVLLVHAGQIGLRGELPGLVANADSATPGKVTRHPNG